MSTRKIIQFGKNSFVISIPKSWALRNKLLKGSEVSVDESAGSLLIAPAHIDGNSEVRIKKISCDEDSHIERSIIAAYMNNYSIIEIYGQKLKDNVKKIEEVTHNLVALEIMEQTPKKIIIKDFLNTNDISMENIIKRMDIIIRAMFSEIEEGFEKKTRINLDKRDNDVNRLFYVGQKLLNKLLDNPNLSKTLNMDIKETLFYWKILDYLEKIADQQKRFIRNINLIENKCPVIEPLKDTFILMTKEYLNLIKALYQFDKNEANKILSSKREILAGCDEIIEKYVNKCKKTKEIYNATEAVEKLKRFENYITQIAKAMINRE